MTETDAGAAAGYGPPVDALLGRGVPSYSLNEWADYPAEHGLGAEHVPDLVRMATDQALHDADADSPKVWAPVHAWRALGQLRAEAAIEPVLRLLEEASASDDWAFTDLPTVLARIGRPAIPALRRFLTEPNADTLPHNAAAEALRNMADLDPSLRDEAVAILSERLEAHAENDPELNAFLVSFLTDLGAVEAAPIMERAFAADDVDEFVCGDWEDIQVELGLLEKRLTPPRSYAPRPLPAAPQPAEPQAPKSKSRKKSKRKMQKQSRKQNRKRR
jgi:hypothetical protein